jgi:hypothetical protein
MTNGMSAAASNYNYEVILTERDGRFYLRIPELHLIAEGPSVATAHAELEEARGKLFERYATLGIDVPPSRDVRVRSAMREQVMPFALKAAVIGLVGSVLVISAAVAINYALRDPLRHAAQKVGWAAVLQITAGLEDFARRELTPDHEERLRNGLRGVVPILRPFIEELQPLFPDDKRRP